MRLQIPLLGDDKTNTVAPGLSEEPLCSVIYHAVVKGSYNFLEYNPVPSAICA